MIKEYTPDTWPSDKIPNFSHQEMACRETGECRYDLKFLVALQALRSQCGFALSVSSGYRSPQHSAERDKAQPGAHTYGCAVDLKVSGDKAYIVLREALKMGFTGIGIAQRGDHAKRFIHLDRMSTKVAPGFPRPALFSY